LLQHAAVSGVRQSRDTTAPVPVIPEPLLLAAK